MVKNILNKVGNTPLVPIGLSPMVRVFAKLEFYNPTGSVKDRAACYLLNRLLNEQVIDSNTTIIESSSGNFGVALSAYCKLQGLRFICVIDENTLPVNEMLIKLQMGELIKISEPDQHGGFLLNRLKKVKEIISQTENIYWANQYGNPLVAEAYYSSLGKEICLEAPRQEIDYVFLGVSSGGTITGVSQRIKEENPDTRVIAVDVLGSVIFGGGAKKRFIPGIGSSITPAILENACIDEVVYVSEMESINCCRELLANYNLYAGGSSGSVYAAIKKYFAEKEVYKPVNVMCIFADSGERYITTIYNDDWCQKVSDYERDHPVEVPQFDSLNLKNR